MGQSRSALTASGLGAELKPATGAPPVWFAGIRSCYENSIRLQIARPFADLRLGKARPKLARVEIEDERDGAVDVWSSRCGPFQEEGVDWNRFTLPMPVLSVFSAA
jgi:hypothetical protein